MRRCGDCSECCAVLEIVALSKPVNVPCSHLCAVGCGVYSTRPDACSSFRCGWLDGSDRFDRPDISGVMVRTVSGHTMLIETRAGALDNVDGPALVRRFGATRADFIWGKT